jgi:hypothetical protein
MCLLSRRELLIQAGRAGAIAAFASACAPAPAQANQVLPWWQLPAASMPLAFVDVTVVPMDEERILPHQTVLVSEGRIAEVAPVGSEAVPLTDATLQVDGRGRYLLPGLADMHVHLHDPLHGLLYLANGVTTVRNMWGFPTHLAAIHQVERGHLLAPTMYTTGPLMDGSPPYWIGSTVVNTAAEAEASVEAQHADGFKSLKVYESLTRDAYRGIVTAARRLDMRVVGHVPKPVGLRAVLAEGQRSIEHLRGYIRGACRQRDDRRISCRAHARGRHLELRDAQPGLSIGLE